MKLIAFLVLFYGICSTLSAQNFRFNEYTTEDGIAQNFIYTIDQDQQGYLWVGTGEGLSKFDGKKFTSFGIKNGLSENPITCSYFDEGNEKWFGHNEGSLTHFKNSIFTPVTTGGKVKSVIKSIDKIGNTIYFISQNEGLCAIEGEEIEIIGDFEKSNFSSFKIIDSLNILMGTDEGLIHVAFENNKWVFKSESLTDYWIGTISSGIEPNTYFAAGKSGGLFKVKLDNGKLLHSAWDGELNFDDIQITTIYVDNDSNIWLGTSGIGAIKLHYAMGNEGEHTFYNSSTGLNSDFINAIEQDREGNIWIGTFGNGLLNLIDDYFTFYNNDLEAFNNKNVNSLIITETDRWYGLDEGLLQVPVENPKQYTIHTDTTTWEKYKVTSLFLKDSIIWIGTSSNGVSSLDLRTGKFEKVSTEYGILLNRINQISGNDDILVFATDGGLITYNNETKRSSVFDTEAGLAHNAIKSVYVTTDGKIWIGTHSRFLYAINGFQLDEYEIRTTGELEVTSISQDNSGFIWVGTSHNGVFKKVGKNFIHFSEREGLKSNYTYSIQHDQFNKTWIGHRGGLSVVSPSGETINVYDYKNGIKEQMNHNAVYVDHQNYLWFGTDEGAFRYDASKDVINKVAPTINLLNVYIQGDSYNLNEPIDLPYGTYRVQFSYIGISFKDPENIYYQFKLNGYDDYFSDPTKETSATYGRLSEGNYTFEVVACNENGICSESTAKVVINIALPIWKKWWFYALMGVAIFLIVNLIIRQRIKRIKKTKDYLEKQLVIKTKEVVEKAEEIEEINKDLTSSINYAKRIQSSMLPRLTELKTLIPKSFVYFLPRDIVSGDFYYVERYNDKLVVGCVDCTGHGVPGGFMSMIGSVTLRNIYKANEARGVWQTPELILEELDHEVEKILKQNKDVPEGSSEFYKSRDGMDMTLIEIDLNTQEVLLSSAMRTSLLYQNNELITIPGTKRPIGGGETLIVPFSLEKIQLKKGDGLYLFSDGYPDQFGGPRGRKLKLAGVKSIIESLKDMPHEQHEQFVKDSFENWLRDYDQIDDVLFMGIEF